MKLIISLVLIFILTGCASKQYTQGSWNGNKWAPSSITHKEPDVWPKRISIGGLMALTVGAVAILGVAVSKGGRNKTIISKCGYTGSGKHRCKSTYKNL